MDGDLKGLIALLIPVTIGQGKNLNHILGLLSKEKCITESCGIQGTHDLELTFKSFYYSSVKAMYCLCGKLATRVLSPSYTDRT